MKTTLLLTSLAALAAAQNDPIPTTTTDTGGGGVQGPGATGGSPTFTSATTTRFTSRTSSSTTRPIASGGTSAGADGSFQPEFPNGRQNINGDLLSSVPLNCLLACNERFSNYYFCFGEEGSSLSSRSEFCRLRWCSQESYDHLTSCLNCVIANGEERLNSRLSSVIASATIGGFDDDDDDDLLDREEANEWLSSVEARCLTASLTTTRLASTTVTATPTTTGPYYTTWVSGATVQLPVWTGVTQYTRAIDLATRTDDGITMRQSNGEGPSATPSGSAASSSAAAAGASALGAAQRHASVPLPLAFLGRLVMG